ncbi:SpoIIE family protein phosphatase [Frisingicoccus sp.]|uniref:SpoIIE family protein phosphatase n=1 Tax=Frisingicoccus sp. TaxID=1918627 RepID=UPI0025C6A6EC|nr:SpoIIE family protein phosphatase [Frisingicoccus sp.]MDD6232210.1 SpoIIE family protein phosphatase [Frisingicoccus sp.]MDY4921928.1 SpoIIE family protein phosphatase [Frisingicoccus sp.]
MNVSIDVSWKSLNKHDEELCGDKVEILKTDDSDIIILADGMGSGVKANILATLASKILGTMFLEGEPIEEAVETLASTLPICKVRGVAYSTFSILQIFHNGDAYLVEFDNPSCVFVRNKKLMKIPENYREISGKKIREYRFKVEPNDCFVLMSDGTIYAGVGELLNLGWTWESMAEYTLKCAKETKSAARIASLLSQACDDLYQQRPGDDTTVAVARVIERRIVNIFTGPPKDKEDDRKLMMDFMASEGKKIVCGGTTSKIAAQYLGQNITNNNDGTKEVPPTANIRGIDLVTEGVLTMSHTFKLLRRFDEGDIDEEFFDALDANNGGAKLARILLEDCTEVNLFVGKANNEANYEGNTLFDISIRKNLVVQLKEILEHLGKQVKITYY